MNSYLKNTCLSPSRLVDSSIVLEHIELQISKVKEEAFSRKDILDKVQKWLAACEEECWLEEYNRDDSRYNAGRGTHLILKRAEKARAVVNKIPAMVEALTSKATAWEKERGIEFSYDGVHLLSMLENYSIFKQEKEQECQRQRDQKKLQGQLLAEQEVLFGSKPSPSKSGNKLSRTSSIGGASSRRMSLGGAMLQASNSEKATFPCHPLRKSNSVRQHNSRNHLPSGSFLDLSSGGLNAKQHRCNAANVRETKSQRIRKPLSPVNSALSYKSSTPNIQDLSRKTPSTTRTLVMSPAKIISTIDDDEHKTPRTMPVPLPNTPPTMSVAMQTAMTTPCVPGGAEDVEYSFEERRASFVLSK